MLIFPYQFNQIRLRINAKVKPRHYYFSKEPSKIFVQIYAQVQCNLINAAIVVQYSSLHGGWGVSSLLVAP